jgi:hypothetical protein
MPEAITLRRVAALTGCPIVQDKNGRRRIVRHYPDDMVLEVCPSHIFDERGVTVTVHGSQDKKLVSKPFSIEKFEQVWAWAERLAGKPQVFRRQALISKKF